MSPVTLNIQPPDPKAAAEQREARWLAFWLTVMGVCSTGLLYIIITAFACSSFGGTVFGGCMLQFHPVITASVVFSVLLVVSIIGVKIIVE